MPELPEVEMTRRHLEAWLVGARVVMARSDDARITRGSPRAFGRSLVGATIAAVDRRGKWLAVRARASGGGDVYVFSHLGMTGKWMTAAPTDAPLRSEHARLDVAHGRKITSVRYLDPRRFGRLLVAASEIDEWRALGPDPYLQTVDARTLAAAFARSKRPIKDALMDQRAIAGVGNIIATDALFRARIDPRTPAKNLGVKDLASIARALRTTIAAGIAEHERSSLRYLHEIDDGNPFLVYGRGGEPCPRCKQPLAKMVLGGRGTAFCPRCQRRVE